MYRSSIITYNYYIHSKNITNNIQMKNKINLRKTLIATMAVASITFSCKDSFLEVLPTGSLGEAQLTSKAGVEGSLLGAYSMVLGKNYSRLAGPNNWVLGSILGGDANKGTDEVTTLLLTLFNVMKWRLLMGILVVFGTPNTKVSVDVIVQSDWRMRQLSYLLLIKQELLEKLVLLEDIFILN
jgi:hypothetical protein